MKRVLLRDALLALVVLFASCQLLGWIFGIILTALSITVSILVNKYNWANQLYQFIISAAAAVYAIGGILILVNLGKVSPNVEGFIERLIDGNVATVASFGLTVLATAGLLISFYISNQNARKESSHNKSISEVQEELEKISKQIRTLAERLPKKGK